MTKRATRSATLTTRREPRLGFVLAIVSAGWMLATIDLFIVNIAFPTLQRSFHGAHLSTLSWVLNGYTIVFAALLVPAGRLADRTSLKRSFLVGVAVFTLGSALCAAANGVGVLIAARVVQATGAAVMVPCSLGLLLAAFPAERRLGAVRLLAAMGGLSRVRTFALSTLALLLFSTSFATLLLSILLWTQTVWGWSALRTGLAFAPGPLMVPLFSIGAGKLAPRVGAGTLALLGCVSFAAAGIVWALAIGLHIDYAAAMLPGTLLTGVGVGLTLPTLTATATSSLPRDRFATGSAVINMARQIGFTLGVAVLVARLGKPDTPGRDLAAYQHGWEVGAGLAFAAAVISALLIRRPQHTPAHELVTEPTR